jgi:hypothetical protein
MRVILQGISYTLKQDLLAPGEQGKMKPLLRCATKPAILGARDTGVIKIVKSEEDVLLQEAYSPPNINQISRLPGMRKETVAFNRQTQGTRSVEAQKLGTGLVD